MTQEVKIVLPKLGESIVSATVVRWFKRVGDRVALDEPLLEVTTDKVGSEIPSPVAGVLREILALPDTEVQVGAPLALLAVEGGEKEEGGSSPFAPPPSAREPSSSRERSDLLSPAVLRLLKEKGIGLDQIDRIPCTGEGGRLTKKDVEAFSLTKCPLAAPPPSFEQTPERLKMTGMRKAIADNMVRSFYQAPHASLLTEVDVTSLVKWIQREKESFLKAHGVKLTVSPFLARSIAQAVRSFPLINSSLDEDTIVVKRTVNLGIAVSVEQGVMVPVLRRCDTLSFLEIAKELASLAERARAGRLLPQEVQEGTLTMTNFGMGGTLIGIPIIRYPEVAIVGLGAIHKKVVPLADDTIAVRSMMWVSLTFDHRVLDGLYGCGFLKELKRQVEEMSLPL